MKFKISRLALAAVVGLGMVSCEDYLNKPQVDNYNADNFYENDIQCLNGTSYLYSSPWSDFTRNFINVGEVLSGNFFISSTDPYQDFSVNPSDAGMGEMSNSLWAVNSHCNMVYNYIKAASGPSEAVKNQTLGECLTWKAMAYFFLVRSFGDVPIINDNSKALADGSFRSVSKINKADVYEYIVMTLEEAIRILPAKAMQEGRIDKATAQGLLAKVYLAKAGSTGTLNKDDLDNAVKYANQCLGEDEENAVNKEIHYLMPEYSDLFRLKNNINPETLLAWRWNGANHQYTDQSFMQSDYAPEGFSENGDCWGQWKGISTDLQEAFGIKVLEQTPEAWLNHADKRLKATMMLPGFKYDYFWVKKKGGFDWLKFLFDDTYNPDAYHNEGETAMPCPTGAFTVKHLVGDKQDHIDGIGYPSAFMVYALATPILRLSDVYLVKAEALLLLDSPSTSGSTTNKEALAAINAVRKRAGVSQIKDKLTFKDIWNERRLELAMEGDRWYDFVRVSYWDAEFAINELKNQKRNQNWGLSALYKNYYKTGDWTVDPTSMMYDDKTTVPVVENLMNTDPETGSKYFALPFPASDVVYNKNLASAVPSQRLDVRNTYGY